MKLLWLDLNSSYAHSSCEDDEDIYDDLMGRTWVGDLWFGSDKIR